MLRTFTPKSVVLTTSDLKNLPAATSIPAMFKASAFFAVPFSLGKNPPINVSIYDVVAGLAILIPDLITSNPEITTLGVKLSLLIITTGISLR